jgi:hypothetical protein
MSNIDGFSAEIEVDHINVFITHHCNRRMSQRGITKNQMKTTFKYGHQNGDKIVLNKKTIKNILKYNKLKSDDRKQLVKILDKGGIVLICENSSLITTYNVNSYKRGKNNKS